MSYSRLGQTVALNSLKVLQSHVQRIAIFERKVKQCLAQKVKLKKQKVFLNGDKNEFYYTRKKVLFLCPNVTFEEFIRLIQLIKNYIKCSKNYDLKLF